MVNQDADTELIVLDRQLRRLRRKATRLQRNVQEGTAQWVAWPSTLDEALALVDRIARVPAAALPGLAIKITAIVWFLEQTDAVLDANGMRQLRALAREARRLARA